MRGHSLNIILFLGLSSFIPAAHSQTLAEATELLEAGECNDAAEMLRSIISKKPKDAEASYQLGLSLLCAGEKRAAEKEFLSALKKGSNPANYQLAELSLTEYRIEDAQKYIADYRKGLKKAKKGTSDMSEDFDERLDRISAMLDRVEKIVILDSIEVDADLFFRHYALAKESGTFNLPEILGKGIKSADPTIVFETGDNRERIWAIENENHVFELVSATALYGGEWSDPTPLGAVLNEGGDANYPFLMSDGMTLYFANDGENSIGGYDIFITRRDGEEFLQPTNMGFPYNSTADDYLLAIDESKGIGWWATNRNGHQDSVTIYAFIPSDMRINYGVDDPELASKARIDSFESTWEGKDYSKIKDIFSTPALATTNSRFGEPEFTLSVPGKGIFKSLSEFKNPKARSMMQQYLIAREQYDELSTNLEKLRQQYKTNKSGNIAQKIIFSENDLIGRRKSLMTMRNEIVSIENGGI